MSKWKAIGTHLKNIDVLVVDLDGRINIIRYIKHILPYSDFNCGKEGEEDGFKFEGNYAFCSSRCYGQFVGVC